jgi:hypothetical protein
MKLRALASFCLSHAVLQKPSFLVVVHELFVDVCLELDSVKPYIRFKGTNSNSDR